MNDIVVRCTNQLLGLFPDASMYLYGGVAQGKKNSKYSDLDLMLFFSNELDEGQKNIIKDVELRLTGEFKNDFAYVGIEVVTPLLYKLEQNLVYALLVKSLGIHIGGTSIEGELPDVYLNRELGYQLNADFETRIEKKYKDFLQMKNAQDKLLACRWIMKKLLRTSFGLIIDKVDYFENDIQGLVSTISKFYPEKSKEIEEIGFLVDDPSLDIGTIQSVISHYFEWLKIERKNIYTH